MSSSVLCLPNLCLPYFVGSNTVEETNPKKRDQEAAEVGASSMDTEPTTAEQTTNQTNQNQMTETKQAAVCHSGEFPLLANAFQSGDDKGPLLTQTTMDALRKMSVERVLNTSGCCGVTGVCPLPDKQQTKEEKDKAAAIGKASEALKEVGVPLDAASLQKAYDALCGDLPSVPIGCTAGMQFVCNEKNIKDLKASKLKLMLDVEMMQCAINHYKASIANIDKALLSCAKKLEQSIEAEDRKKSACCPIKRKSKSKSKNAKKKKTSKSSSSSSCGCSSFTDYPYY